MPTNQHYPRWISAVDALICFWHKKKKRNSSGYINSLTCDKCSVCSYRPSVMIWIKW